MNKVQVEILGLSSSPSTGGAYALLLKEVYGVRRLPIIIGAFEAQAIALEIEDIKPPRPLTHDLCKNLCDNLGATIQEVLISDLRDNTFYASIKLEVSSLENILDSRPSDAIALAVRADCPIFVNEAVMEAASFIPSSEEDSKTKRSSDQDEDMEDDFEQSEDQIKTETSAATLHDQLREAIENEDYERAAIIRDKINEFKKNN
ncbi:MAG: bifunctional nuclease family protein [Melioribacteraceae bacterium]|nr:bifunctional nuclease family protein [Melioribacteraceae bacterium]